MSKRIHVNAWKEGLAKSRSSIEWGSSERPGDRSCEMEDAFRRAIVAIPPGKVSSYGGVAAAAGYPRYHRAVARLLHQDHRDQLPWHRVLGADGTIKTSVHPQGSKGPDYGQKV